MSWDTWSIYIAMLPMSVRQYQMISFTNVAQIFSIYSTRSCLKITFIGCILLCLRQYIICRNYATINTNISVFHLDLYLLHVSVIYDHHQAGIRIVIENTNKACLMMVMYYLINSCQYINTYST